VLKSGILQEALGFVYLRVCPSRYIAPGSARTEFVPQRFIDPFHEDPSLKKAPYLFEGLGKNRADFTFAGVGQ
jgi:hypothetical protein